MEVSGISHTLYSDYEILKVQSSIPNVRLDMLFFMETEVAAVVRAGSAAEPTSSFLAGSQLHLAGGEQ